ELDVFARTIKSGAPAELDVNGEKVMIDAGDVFFAQKTLDDVAAESFSGGHIYLNLKLNKELISEGFVKDVVRRIQSMRKDAELAYDDRIKLKISSGSEDRVIIEQFSDFIRYETLSDELIIVDDTGSDFTEWEVHKADGKASKIGISLEKV
ncbi:MAG: DUF5915 domain-containing protein, partial [Candidatus Hodarchaeales archaeon]